MTAFYEPPVPEPTNELDSAACTACGLPWAAHQAMAVITMPGLREGDPSKVFERAVDTGDCVVLLKAELTRLRESTGVF